MQINVKKRNNESELFDVEKIHKVISLAIDGLDNVSLSDIEFNANLALYDGMSSKEIHEILIRSANDLISEESPNYQYVAARLLLYSLRKEVWGGSEPPRLYEHIKKCISLNIYDNTILDDYTESEIHKINKFVKHDRDNKFTYSGLQQLVDKYLIKNRSDNTTYETPQFAYILIAMCLFSKYDKNKRLSYIRRAYNHMSEFKINLPTPIMCGVRTPIRQYSSCILIDVDDSMKSIFSSVTATGYYTAMRAGIGLNIGRIRPIGSQIRHGEVIHTGVIPFLKVLESTCKSCSQNGVRGGGGTVNIPIWHHEIESVLVLKNNSGTDDNRVKRLDYCIGISRLFYERLIKNQDITLFSPEECTGLYDSFGTSQFDDLYVKYENDSNIQFKKQISARKLFELLTKERLETGRIYILNIDEANRNSSWTTKVSMCNLCAEVIVPTKPLTHIDDPNAEIGVCTLSAINVLETKLDEYEDVCDIIVRMLDEILDYQTYPVEAAKNFAVNRRSLGVGITNLAAYLAKHKVKYTDNEALVLVDEIGEYLQFFLLTASSNLAREKGVCSKYDETTYSNGVLPIDRYNKNVDSVCLRKPFLDWESLRQTIKASGLRHSSLSCVMPAESSSVIQNSTNGMEPIRAILSYKKSKQGVLKQLAPHHSKLKNHYTLAFDMPNNTGIIRIAAVLQKWIDMSISLNNYYNYAHYKDGQIPLSVLVKDMLEMYKYGIKTLYYTNTPDGDTEYQDVKTSNCEGGACSI